MIVKLPEIEDKNILIRVKDCFIEMFITEEILPTEVKELEFLSH